MRGTKDGAFERTSLKEGGVFNKVTSNGGGSGGEGRREREREMDLNQDGAIATS